MRIIITITFTVLLVTSLIGQVKQQLDSLIAENYNGTWTFYSKNYHVYDADEREVEKIYTYQDQYTGQLEEYKTEYTYNAGNEIILQISASRPYGTAQWTLKLKREYTFDLNDNLIETSYSYWDTATMQWVFNEKFEQNYDTDGNLTLFKLASVQALKTIQSL